MSEQITNLNRARKDSARAERRAKADANAAKHGRTKAQKILEATRQHKARTMLDQHHLDGDLPE